MNVQNEAVEKLQRLKVGALFMDMGTGKTKVALDLMASRAGKCDLFVWITPASLRDNFERERQKWHPELEIVVVNAEGLGASDRVYALIMEQLEKAECSFVVVDESLKIKNIKAKRTKKILAISKLAKYKLLLNGTPLSNTILDIWPQMEFLSPSILRQTFNQFRKNYCIFSNKNGRITIKGYANLPNLMALISPYIFEAKLDLGAKKHYHTCTYEMNRDEEEDYRAFKREQAELLLKDETHTEASFFAFITLVQKWYISLPAHNALVDDICAKIDGQVIVFCRFKVSIPPGVESITGDVPLAERTEIIERFRNGEFKRLYITLGCGSFGLNLQFVHNVIFADQTWDLATQLQSEARVYRTGQADDVNYYNIICESAGLEQKIINNRARKSDLLKDIRSTIVATNTNEEKIATIVNEL